MMIYPRTYTGYARLSAFDPDDKDVVDINQVPSFHLEWESVRPTLEELKAYCQEWDDGERCLLVKLTAEIKEVERWPDDFSIRGEVESEGQEQKTLFAEEPNE